MRLQFLTSCFILISLGSGYAQESDLDSLKKVLAASKNDTLRLILSGTIANGYSEVNPDSAYRYADQMLQVTRLLDLRMEEAVALGEIGYALLNMGNYPRSLQALLQSISITEDASCERNVLTEKYPASDEFTDRSQSPRMQRLNRLSRVQQYAAILYGNSGNYEKAITFYRKAIPNAEAAGSLQILSITYTTLGRTYLSLNKKDSALIYLQKGYDYAIEAGYKRYQGSMLLNIGRVYLSMGQQELAKQYFQRSLRLSTDYNYYRGVVASNLALADLYKISKMRDSSLYHIKKGLVTATYLNGPDLLLRSYTAMAGYYQGINSDSTVKYQALVIKINNEIFNAKQVQQFQNIDFDEQQRLKEMETTEREFQARLRTNLLLGGIFTLVVIAFFLYRNNRTKQKAKQHIEKAYEQLKATQSQLIQSEKMASLGELTAGIAHEIQNPLNFVNNFSEVSTELVDELNDSIKDGNLQAVTGLASDLKQNLEKILHHGKRADGIVKGMLHHSRNSSGIKEPTDINALVDEYLRLAYHGLRAKDKSFNAAMHSDLDPGVGKVNVIPQDLGRVILNLITNGFHAVSQKKKTSGNGFEPSVTVITRRTSTHLQIIVKDNGDGVPQNILDKIFQPFFTTKPAGQGTGLGLSMSYDIITKVHGGTIDVDTKAGEGSSFIITIPINA
ncbi:MAG: tetratricopeptide repeat protein [Cyclobacteriaceae bacterium]|nr:tetratricopeptide repeat protein [Cyclobacteriaceae bacterium]